MAKPRLEPTPEFYQFGLGFHQDLDVRGKTEDEIWAIVLDPFTGQDRIRLREFLDRITRDDVFDAELLRLWNATPTDDWFSDGGLRIILKQARPAASAAEPPVLARARPVRSAQRLTGRRRRADGTVARATHPTRRRSGCGRRRMPTSTSPSRRIGFRRPRLPSPIAVRVHSGSAPAADSERRHR